MADFDDLLGLAVSPGLPAVPPTSELVPTGVGGERSMGAYEGADRYDRTLGHWQPRLTSADAEIIPSKKLSDARGRDMMRNDAFVQGGAQLHKDNIVGSQFMLNAKPSSLVLFGAVDDEWETAFQEEVEELFGLCAESPDNLFDASRMNTFTALVRLAVGVHVAGGEVLGTVEWKNDGRAFKTAIQMVDADRLSTPARPYDLRMNPNMRAGILKDDYGVPQSYFIKKTHPLDYRPMFTNPADLWTWVEIPVRKPWGRLQVIHLINQQRVDQTRGIAEMVAALKEMHITHKFRDVTLQNAVTQALFAASITSDMPTEQIFARLGGGQSDASSMERAMTDYMVGYFNTIGEYCGGADNLQVDGVRIPHLPPGSKLDMVKAGSGGPLGMEFEQSLLRYIAATLGVSYEQLSRDYTNTNYSSARAAMTETWKFMQARKTEIADRFATIIYRLWLEEMVNSDQLKTFPASKAAMLYGNGSGRGMQPLNMKFDALSRCDWIGASRGQIDELKETQAAILRVNNGLSTWEDEIARLGGDWRKKFRQMGREQELATKLKLRFMAEPVNPNQMNAASGTPKDKGGTNATALFATGEAGMSIGTKEALYLDAPADVASNDEPAEPHTEREINDK